MKYFGTCKLMHAFSDILLFIKMFIGFKSEKGEELSLVKDVIKANIEIPLQSSYKY